MIFIWVVNMLGFIPLPLSGETWHASRSGASMPRLVALGHRSRSRLMTFVFTHVEGIRANGPIRYFKSWIPDVPKVMLPLIVPLEILGSSCA
jgi:F0F1-type ATP synthase membrane subunit a